MLNRREIQDVERLVRKCFTETPAHTLGHLERVSKGASWLVRFLGGSKEEARLAYLAGWLHDLYRPATDKVNHIGKTVQDAEQILREVGIKGEEAEAILLAVRDHRRPVDWQNLVHKSVYVADKFLEQMGGYSVFRRCLYVGESEDFLEPALLDGVIPYFERRFALLEPENFPSALRAFVSERNGLPKRFFIALEAERKWAIALAKHAYNCGRKGILIEDFVNQYHSKGAGHELHSDALRYLSGEIELGGASIKVF